MSRDNLPLPLDMFPKELQQAIIRISHDVSLSADQRQKQIDSLIREALKIPEVRYKINEELRLRYPQLSRRIQPDDELKSEERHATGPPEVALIAIFVALLRYPATWIILGLILLISMSNKQC